MHSTEKGRCLKLDATRNHLAQLATRWGQLISRYGLVVVLAWIGFGKFVKMVWPRVSAAGSALAVVLFVGTLSFLFTTPGVVATHAGGVPVLSALPGQFLLKDLVLIGVTLWTLGDSLGAARFRRRAALPRSAVADSPSPRRSADRPSAGS
jgi:uncharacterized membrane protein YkgB